MDDVAQLLAIAAIRDVKARYFLCLDAKDWDGWAQVFAPDAEMDVSGEFQHLPDPSRFVFRTPQGIVAAVSGALGDVVTVHHGHTPLIRIVGENDATGIWAMEDNLFGPGDRHVVGYGHYHERYRRIDGRWCIAHTRLTRLKVVAGTIGSLRSDA